MDKETKRVRLVVAYDGTNYHGWQLQPGAVTVEEVLNGALAGLLGEPIQVIGASRTDSGVHARGNVAVFDTVHRMPADKVCFALNQRLPEDIRIQSSDEVPPDWHPRKCSCVKTYEYRILNRRMELPSERLYSHFCHFDLDLERMRQAAEHLTGRHDFKSFCNVHTQAEDTVRTVYGIDIENDGGGIVTIRVTGNGFLYNMIRIIAGTLMEVGMGRRAPSDMVGILDACDRRAAGPTAPAKGLTLVGIRYENGENGEKPGIS